MSRRVAAIVADLFFATKIAATAEAAGVGLETLDVAAARNRWVAAGAGDLPSLVLVDLALGEAALAFVRELRTRPDAARLPIAGFYSHVDTATRDAALAAGVDPVLPRSAFVARLPALLTGATPGR